MLDYSFIIYIIYPLLSRGDNNTKGTYLCKCRYVRFHLLTVQRYEHVQLARYILIAI